MSDGADSRDVVPSGPSYEAGAGGGAQHPVSGQSFAGGRDAGAAYKAALDLKFTDPKRYHSEEHQRLLHQLASAQPNAEQPLLSSAEHHGVVAAPSLSDWLKAGNDHGAFDAHRQVVGRVNDVLVGMPDDARAEVNDSFARLPQKVQAAAVGAFTEARATGAVRFSEDDMQRIRSVPAYATLAREWGHEAPRRFGALRARISHATSRLDDADFNAALDWLDDLPPSAVAAVGRVLSQ